MSAMAYCFVAPMASELPWSACYFRPLHTPMLMVLMSAWKQCHCLSHVSSYLLSLVQLDRQPHPLGSAEVAL